MHYFIFYVDASTNTRYLDPRIWLDVDFLFSLSSTLRIFGSQTHRLHDLGLYTKNYGLANAIIIEAETDDDLMLLQLQKDRLIQSPVFSNHPSYWSLPPQTTPPVLQLILRDLSWKTIDPICEDLDNLKRESILHRDDLTNITALQKMMDRTHMTVIEMEDSVSESYQQLTDQFITGTQAEIERIKLSQSNLRKKLAAARRRLIKEMKKFSTL